MIEPKFKVILGKEDFKIESMNNEAIEVYKEITSLFSEESFLKFILLSPNSMTMINGELIYELDLTSKEEVILDIKRNL